MKPFKKPSRTAGLRQQQGLSMMFTLVMVGAMALSAVAMVRTTDTGSIAIGNMSFQHDARRTADYVTEEAIKWLETNAGDSNVLDGTTASKGYYAKFNNDWSSLDFNKSDSDVTARIDWGEDSCPGFTGKCLTPSDEIETDDLYTQFNDLVRESGIKGRYIILRLCDSTNADAKKADCARTPLPAADVAADPNARSGEIFYRIIVYTKGPRNTRAYTETMVHMAEGTGNKVHRTAWRELVD